MAESGNLGGRNVRYRWQKGKPLRWQKGKAEVAERQSLYGRKVIAEVTERQRLFGRTAELMWQKGRPYVAGR